MLSFHRAKSFHVNGGQGPDGQIIDALQQAIDETGARRLLIETFSRAETRLFAAEVIPVLKQRSAA